MSEETAKENDGTEMSNIRSSMDKTESDMPNLSEVVRPVPGFLNIVMGVFAFLAVGSIALTVVADGADKPFKAADKYHPQAASFKARHFSAYVGSSLYEDTTCMATVIARDAAKKAGVEWKGSDVECTFDAPYTAVFAALFSAFFGLTVVVFYAKEVMAAKCGTKTMADIADTIHDASKTFLHTEYKYLVPFIFVMFIFLFVAIDLPSNAGVPASSVSFLFGAFLSMGCGYMGMNIATQGNTRTAAAAAESLSAGLRVAFRSGAVMGLGVVSCGILGLCLSYICFNNTNALGGFGFGASCVALFARVGGGIYTKAADVGADLVGKVEADIPEDDPRNPATIADCVGDNVGDVAGMGADLFESYVGAVVAAAVLGSAEFGSKGVALPFWIVMFGLIISVFGTWHVKATDKSTMEDLLKSMRINVIASATVIVITCIVFCILFFEPETAEIAKNTSDAALDQQNPGVRLFGSILVGLVAGILIGLVTEYYTSHTERPTRSIAEAADFGPGPVIIQGLGQGMYSTIVPSLLIVGAVLGAYYLAGFYGTAIACVGMLSTLGVTMATDAYGPVSDNAGGIAEMTPELPDFVRDRTDLLDALGNTTAATGKGFANGSAVLSALSLLAAYARVADIDSVDVLQPVVVIGLLIGALLPYVFGAMTMLSVNLAAQEMIVEVRRQFADGKVMAGERKPDYGSCVAISTKSSLREMVMPGVLAVFAPVSIGFIFGSHALVGLLLGAISSGYLLGVMMSNTGGAWDNAKKYIESGELGEGKGKGSDQHHAAVCGDTVGDPFKDTSGPSLNILIKLMTRFAFVAAPLFVPDFSNYWIGLILLAVATIFSLVFYKMTAESRAVKIDIPAAAVGGSA